MTADRNRDLLAEMRVRQKSRGYAESISRRSTVTPGGKYEIDGFRYEVVVTTRHYNTGGYGESVPIDHPVLTIAPVNAPDSERRCINPEQIGSTPSFPQATIGQRKSFLRNVVAVAEAIGPHPERQVAPVGRIGRRVSHALAA